MATDDLNRHVRTLRIAGAGLLLLGWLIISIPNLGSALFIVNTIVLAALSVYAFLAAAHGRRISVNLERKLRLSLLVHNVELENMAMRDDLTHLFNRRYFFERLERELQTAHGFQRSLSVVIIDLDCMKTVNDTFGHLVGDRLLAAFGRFLLDQARGSDIPARIGGDEFAVILPDTGEEGARIVVDRLVQALARADLIGEAVPTLVLSASLGISGYPWGGDTVDTIMQLADASMYAHKRLQKSAGQETIESVGPAINGDIPAAFRKMPEEADTNADTPQSQP